MPQKRSLLPWLLGGCILAMVCCAAAAVMGVIFFLRPTTIEVSPGTEATAVTESLPAEAATPAVDATPAATARPAQATDEPTPGASPAPPLAQANFEQGGVSFYLDPRLAAGAAAETIPEMSATDLPPWELGPEHLLVSLQGYPLTGTLHQPGLYIYPVEDFARINPTAGTIFADFRKIMQERPAAAQNDYLPFLPLFNAAQIMHARLGYLDFQNGSGYRFLTQYGQDIFPICNGRLFYTFQGMTHDGAHYVAAILPVNHANLDACEVEVVDPVLYDTFLQYIANMEASLAEDPPAMFTPDLNALDQLVQSLSVK